MIQIPLKNDEIIWIDDLESPSGETQYRVRAGWYTDEPIDYGLEPTVVLYKEAEELSKKVSPDLPSLLRELANVLADHLYNTAVHEQEVAIRNQEREMRK